MNQTKEVKESKEDLSSSDDEEEEEEEEEEEQEDVDEEEKVMDEEDVEEEEEEEKESSRKRKKVKRPKKTHFFGKSSNKQVQQFLQDKWMFRASFIIRETAMSNKSTSPYFEWISKMSPYLSDFVKLDLFLVALNKGNTTLAINVYLALNCPTHLFSRDFVSVLESQCLVANAVDNMVKGIATSPEAAIKHGKRHVLFKLRFITEPITQSEISRSLMRKRIPFEILHLLDEQELWYLKEQKFRIAVPELVD